MEEEPYHSISQSQKHSFTGSGAKKDRYKHLIAFVNTKSGGQQGQKVLKRLKKYLPNDQIIDLIEGPQKGFALIQHIESPVIVACGGDGTICWLLSTMDKMLPPLEKYFPIAIMPLGTGNDLARVMRFGGGFSGDNIEPFLEKIIKGEPILLDRWLLKIYKKEEYNPPPPRPGAPLPPRPSKKSRVYGNSEPSPKITYDPFGPLSKTYHEIPSARKNTTDLNIQDKPETPPTVGKKNPKKKQKKKNIGKLLIEPKKKPEHDDEELQVLDIEESKSSDESQSYPNEIVPTPNIIIEDIAPLESKERSISGRRKLTRSSSCQTLYSGKRDKSLEDPRESLVSTERSFEIEDGDESVMETSVVLNDTKVINNYFSVGIDSKIALDFHKLRNSNPQFFQSKFINYMWYGGIGFKNFFLTAVDLSEVLELYIDEELIKLQKIETIVFLNIPSIYGGTNLWDETKLINNNITHKQYINDKKIEVFGIKSAAHLALLQTPGQVTGGGKYLGVGENIRVELKQRLPAQIDGEPFILDCCKFTISHFNQAPLIYNSNSKYKKNLIVESNIII